jgi:hypothetical protein
MARKSGGLFTGETAVVRSATALLAADNPALTDANIPPAQGLDCSGYDTILVGVEIAGGTAPTMTLEPLFRDDDAADGLRWGRLDLGAAPGVTLAALASEKTPALASNVTWAELRVFGHPNVFLRIDAAGTPTSTTAWKILARPGKVRGDRGLMPKAS